MELQNLILLVLLISVSYSEGRSVKQLGKWPTLTGDPTEINAHRGETVFLPENTLGSTELAAIEMAEHIELDLGLSVDGQLVVFHDLGLRSRTNVEDFPEFADKLSNYTGIVDDTMENVTMTNDWFIKDFTVDELHQLRVQQRHVGVRSKMFNDVFGVPTFDEFLDTVHHAAFRLNKSVGIVIELKNPIFYNINQNVSTHRVEDLVIETLQRFGYPVDFVANPNCTSRLDSNAPIPCGHVIIQSFTLSSMKYLHQQKPAIHKSMLINAQNLPLLTYEGLHETATWASYFSPYKELLYTGILAQIEADGIEYDEELIDQMGGFVPPQDIVREAHAVGMKVYVYTIYDSRERSGRGCVVSCDPENKEVEVNYYFDMGVDGMFSENVPETRELRMKYHYENVVRG